MTAGDPQRVSSINVADSEIPDPSEPETGADAPGAATETPVEGRKLPFEQGDTVSGFVVKLESDGAVLDLGTWVEGFVTARELTPGSAKKLPASVVAVGEEVTGLVTTTRGPDGRPRVSLGRLERESAWTRLEQQLEQSDVLTGRVTAAVKGGLNLDLGVDAFLPASLVDLHPVSDLQSLVGTDMTVKVIESDKRRFRIVVSRRAILEEERGAKRDEVFATLNEGDVISGTVSGVTDIGAFVDVGGADGLVHVTELSWSRVGNPKDVVKVGDEVQVKVLKLDRERDRISLSLKQAAPNPWQEFVREQRVGAVVGAKVQKLVEFGAFVEVAPGVEGLVHISELAPHRIEKPSDVVSVGDEVQVRILDIDVARERLSLSVRAVADPDGADRARSQGGKRGGGRGGGRRDKRGGGPREPRSYSASGDDDGSSLGASISSESLDALDALKAELAGSSDDDATPGD